MAVNPTEPQRPFSDEYLLRYSAEHVFYEIDHFFWLANLLAKQSVISTPSIEDDIRTRNIFIEGFGLHLRNIIDFLFLAKPRPTDVVAADFLPERMWETLKPAVSASLSVARDQANREMAHLSTIRILGNPPAKEWDFQGLANELRPTLRLMTEKALSSRLAPEVTAAIR